MRQIEWQVGNKEIPYWIGIDCLDKYVQYIHSLKPDKIIFISDTNIEKLYTEQLKQATDTEIPSTIFSIQGGEESKNLETLLSLAKKALDFQISRKSIIIGVGGGLIGNISGLLASLLFRGIRFIHYPTTFLAMHDSVTSIKQAVNCNGSKNIIGSYYQPTAILTDLSTLKTLPKNELLNGYFESVKNGLLFGDKYFNIIDQNLFVNDEWFSLDHLEQLILSGVEVKCQLLKKDPLEKGEAIIFEYGHTIGHALELFRPGAIPHGEAIGWGMLCAAYISKYLGYLNDKDFAHHLSKLQEAGLHDCPFLKENIPVILTNIAMDNKKGITNLVPNMVSMVLLKSIGKPLQNRAGGYLHNIPQKVIKKSLHWLTTINSSNGLTLASQLN